MAFPFLHFPFFLNKIFSCSIQDVKVCMLLSSKGFQGKQPFSNIQISGKINWYLFFQWLYFILQFSSVAQSCPTLCDPMDCNMPGLPIHHQLLEFTQTHIHWVGDAIQPSHLLSSPSPLALNLSLHQGLFQWVRSSHQVAKVLELQLQHQSFQWIFRTVFL